MSLPIALQLYTVRDLLAKDFDGTLAQVAKAGFKWVEFAGYYERTPAQIKAACDKLGLKVCSSHTGIEPLRDHMDDAIAAAKTIGFKYLVCSWIGEEYRGVAGYEKAAKILAAAHEKAQAQGLNVCYHNHSFEFEKLSDGRIGMDILFGQPTLASELDVYWVQHGGACPVDYMKKLAGRVPLLHIKDMEKGPGRGFAEVGTGQVNIAKVVAQAQGVGAKYLVIEQDANWKNNNPLESVTLSLRNLEKIVAGGGSCGCNCSH